jgi:GNAT superfamily N-acetyltransferase
VVDHRSLQQRHPVDAAEGADQATMPDLWKLERFDGPTFRANLDDILALYLVVYAEPPYNSGPIWQKEAFLERTRKQADLDGFAGVAAYLPAGELVGFTFGLPFRPGQWWRNSTTDPVEAASKFAIIELAVRRDRRGEGLGLGLLRALLAARPEPYATLTAVADAPARQFYEYLGWEQVGQTAASPDRPAFHVLLTETAQYR